VPSTVKTREGPRFGARRPSGGRVGRPPQGDPPRPSPLAPAVTKFRRPEQGRRRDAAPESSDDEAAVPVPRVAPGAAYSALLGSLAADPGASGGGRADRAARSIRQRLREEAGDSGGDSEGDSEEERVEEEPAGEQPRADPSASEPAASEPAPPTASRRGLCGEAPVRGPERCTVVDPFDRHMDAELRDDQVAALATGSGRARPVQWGGECAPTWGGLAVVSATSGGGGGEGPRMIRSLKSYGVKERCVTRWREVAGDRLRDGSDFASREQQALFAIVSEYRDVLYPLHAYPAGPGLVGRGVAGDGQADDVLDAVLLHVVNHVTKSADRVRKNNAAAEAARESAASVDDIPRDQGFVRPRALVLAPMRNAAHAVVARLMQLAQKETRGDTYQGKARLEADYGAGAGEEDEGARRGGAKPAEHRALFAGNCDDCFQVGVKMTRGAIRLMFRDMLEADVVVASPLSVAQTLEGALKEPGEGRADWLTGIEVLVVARADVLQMQNWRHVETAVGALNRMPEAQHGDIMRVREWALSGMARHYRQTVVLSSFESAEMASLASRLCANHAGAVRFAPEHPGVLGRAPRGVRQVFEGLAAESPAAAADARFEHFRRRVWPRMRDAAGSGQLIFVPSYFDLVRLRKFLKEEDVAVALASEYQDRR